MSITLVLALIELIIKLPEIIKVIKMIVEKIKNRPVHLQGPLINRLERIVSAVAVTGDTTELKAFHAGLV